MSFLEDQPDWFPGAGVGASFPGVVGFDPAG